MSDPTSTPESVPEPRWKCRADHFVYGYCDGPVGARPGHNSCGWSDPPAASSPDEGGELRCEATPCDERATLVLPSGSSVGNNDPVHSCGLHAAELADLDEWRAMTAPASADEGARQRTGGWSLVRDEEPVQASRPWSLYRPDGRRYGTLTDEEAAALQRSHLTAPPAPSTPAHPDEGTERPDTAALREIADRFLLDEDGGILLREACDWIDAQPPAPPTPAPDAERLRKAEELLRLTMDRAELDDWRPLWFANYVVPFLTASPLALPPAPSTPAEPGGEA